MKRIVRLMYSASLISKSGFFWFLLISANLNTVNYHFSDDKVEGIRLSSAFDITCKAWKDRFGVDYTHCGCPVPGNSIGQRLSQMIGLRRYSTSSSQPSPSHLLPPDRSDLLSATHPSDHNAVQFVAANERAHKVAVRRYESMIKKKEKAAKKAEKLAPNSGTGLSRATSSAGVANFQSTGRRSSIFRSRSESVPAYSYGSRDPANVPLSPDEVRRRDRNAARHDPAFLVPVPIFFLAPNITTACVATGAHEVNPLAGCSHVCTRDCFL